MQLHDADDEVGQLARSLCRCPACPQVLSARGTERSTRNDHSERMPKSAINVTKRIAETGRRRSSILDL